MNDTGIRPEVIEEIRNLAQKYDIEKVILFGSRARGDFRRTSDIDIAVTGGDFARREMLIFQCFSHFSLLNILITLDYTFIFPCSLFVAFCYL